MKSVKRSSKSIILIGVIIVWAIYIIVALGNIVELSHIAGITLSIFVIIGLYLFGIFYLDTSVAYILYWYFFILQARKSNFSVQTQIPPVQAPECRSNLEQLNLKHFILESAAVETYITKIQGHIDRVPGNACEFEKYIGFLERTVGILLIMTGNIVAVTLLFIAKNLLVTPSSDSVRSSEYTLMGTMLSLVIVLIIGLLARLVLIVMIQQGGIDFINTASIFFNLR
ncbi:hypothetical protein [Methanoculleus chikugoensis]|uniref:hypothetical protein n=1 Tax=Methanoculleus chikugoensis TaxID=118126 RepID=UPI001C821748|nr:hypothetical protein [Methanoculleus chikugoensis]